MSQRQKLLARLLSAQNDNDLDFIAVLLLLELLGFEKRIRGSHHMLTKSGVVELINIQPASGNKLKPYQVKQIRSILLKYRSILELDLL